MSSASSYAATILTPSQLTTLERRSPGYSQDVGKDLKRQLLLFTNFLPTPISPTYTPAFRGTQEISAVDRFQLFQHDKSILSLAMFLAFKILLTPPYAVVSCLLSSSLSLQLCATFFFSLSLSCLFNCFGNRGKCICSIHPMSYLNSITCLFHLIIDDEGREQFQKLAQQILVTLDARYPLICINDTFLIHGSSKKTHIHL